MKYSFAGFSSLIAFLLLICILGYSPVVLAAPAAGKPITLTIPAHATPAYPDFDSYQRFIDRINQDGKGKVEAKFYPSETLYKVKEIVPALMNGSCEIVFHTSSHTTGSWPEIGGMSLPFLYKDDDEARARWKMGSDLMNLLNREMDRKYGVRVLASGIKPNTRLWTRKKVEEPSDVKGLKIRATGVPDAEAIRAFGGSPNFMSSAEIYEALLRGTIDGLTTYPGTVFARNLDEVVTFCIDFKPAFHTWGYQIYVLNKTFNSWPKEVQAIVLRAAAEYDDYNGEIWGKLLNETIFPRLKKKIKFITPTPEAMNKFEKLALPTYQIWVKTVDKEFGNKLIELSKAPLKH